VTEDIIAWKADRSEERSHSLESRRRNCICRSNTLSYRHSSFVVAHSWILCELQRTTSSPSKL